jgi:hypothetical protein
MTLYMFHIRDTGFVKFGFTYGDPWTRAATGFWSNVHPKECCGKLGWENLELMPCYEGGPDVEAAIKKALPPHTGEFWRVEYAGQLLTLCSKLTNRKLLEEIPKPKQAPGVARMTEKLPCCGGPEFFCDSCNVSFKRQHHLRQHLQSCQKKKVPCLCGKKVLHRNLKRHQAACKAQAAAAISSHRALGIL